MKNIKVLGLAIVASIVAAPAFAGETYVRNEWTKSTGYSFNDLTLDSDTTSHRLEIYDSYADKLYVEGKLDKQTNGNYEGSEDGHIFNKYRGDDTKVATEYGKRPSLFGYTGETEGKYQEVSSVNGGDGYSVHTAGSSLWGVFYEHNTTRLDGKIFSRTDITSAGSHETSSGVR